MAGSIGVNPVVVRNVTGMLKRAGLVRTQQGVAGTWLARPLSKVTLLDVYRAVEDEAASSRFTLVPTRSARSVRG
jgi:DNA-binding IscR family transcriptional regulator